jgi:hypothetical protein
MLLMLGSFCQRWPPGVLQFAGQRADVLHLLEGALEIADQGEIAHPIEVALHRPEVNVRRGAHRAIPVRELFDPSGRRKSDSRTSSRCVGRALRLGPCVSVENGGGRRISMTLG